MVKEKSVGAVVFRKANNPEFLLLHYNAGHWGFPKGHVEGNETEKQTMLREVEEETGLKDLEVLPGFRQYTKYFFRRGEETVFKEVVFYLLEAREGKVKISFEHKAFEWLCFEKALQRLTFKNTKGVLQKAQSLLNERPKQQQSYV